jgi:molybdopterin/thiamine biosynthesis adenylyltransferase
MNASFDYATAFARNLGIIHPQEQKLLQNSHLAVLGLGGVGGINLITLARLGIGKFTIADPDVFELPNFNRQFGAFISTLGRPKAEVMRKLVLDINPEAKVRVFQDPIGPSNIQDFLQGANVLIDSIDAFEIGVRRLAFRQAKAQGIYALGAGPVGFSTAWVIFSPQGMSFDDYFDLDETQTPLEQFVAYIVGIAPAGLHRGYLDFNSINPTVKTGPSVASACQLAAGVIGAEVVKIMLGRGRLYCAPYYHQFDPYLGRYVRRKLLFGNRHPLQRLKRYWLKTRLQRDFQGASA